MVFKLVFAARLSFFGISLAVVQVAGGLINAGMGWFLVSRRTRYYLRCPVPGGQPSYGSLRERASIRLRFPSRAGRTVSGVILPTCRAHPRPASLTTLSPTPEPCDGPLLSVTVFLAMQTLPGSPPPSTLKPHAAACESSPHPYLGSPPRSLGKESLPEQEKVILGSCFGSS